VNEFIKLNGSKLLFAFKATSIIFLTIAIILLTISFFAGQLPDLVLLTVILLTSGIGLPFFILIIAYLEWLSKQGIRKRAFSKPPFDQLDKIGFNRSFINDKNKWYFTETIKEGIINDFKIKCNVTRENSKTILFKALTEPRRIEKNEFKILEIGFQRSDIMFDEGGLTKFYNINLPTVRTIEHLKSDLEQFTSTLKKENFNPAK
jgi:hypothetical protein